MALQSKMLVAVQILITQYWTWASNLCTSEQYNHGVHKLKQAVLAISVGLQY